MQIGFIKKLTLLSLLPFLVTIAHADTTTDSRWGFEVQVYPTGVIPGIRYEWELSTQDQLFARVAYNFTERSDFGEHDDESGGGPGIGLGWRHWLNETSSEWHYGARLDIWDLEIDWEEDGPPESDGKTDIIVMQPSGELGYSWKQSDGSRFDLTAGLGVEVNVDTDGEDVGEGIIALGGISWAFP